jgi:hypothetical protein
MKKRVLAGMLWLFVTWYAWNILATFVGISDIAGPILGLAAGLLFAVDPLGRIWTTQDATAASATDAPVLAELA